jgi:hypothetical protein
LGRSPRELVAEIKRKLCLGHAGKTSDKAQS